MKNKRFHFLFIALFLTVTLFFAQIQVYAKKEEPLSEKELHAKSALLMDQFNGRVLYEKNGYEKLPMASTTKIMTCIYTLEHGNLDDVVTISSNAVNQPKVRLGMAKGQQYRLRDLLYALMLESYNDCAVAIAEHLSGTVEQFCSDMSNKARDLGAYDTNFETPNGLDSANHYTTAYDLALMTRYALQNESFIEIVNTPSYQFQEITNGATRFVSNKNTFLNLYSGAFGVKTGFTGNAGYCFVGAVKQADKSFISVVLASGWPPNKTWKWIDTKKLMNFGFDNFEWKEIGIENPSLSPISILKGQEKQLPLYTDSKKERILMLPSEKFEVQIHIPNQLQAPIPKDMPVGSISYFLNDEEFRCFSIYAQKEIKKINFSFCFQNIIQKFFSMTTISFP